MTNSKVEFCDLYLRVADHVLKTAWFNIDVVVSKAMLDR